MTNYLPPSLAQFAVNLLEGRCDFLKGCLYAWSSPLQTEMFGFEDGQKFHNLYAGK